jgi:hypothetical protein
MLFDKYQSKAAEARRPGYIREVVCATCGESFKNTRAKSRIVRFCSKMCYGESLKKFSICTQCSRSFQNSRQQQMCSVKCVQASRRGKPSPHRLPPREFTCKNCRGEFSKQGKQIRKIAPLFCSRRCDREYKTKFSKVHQRRLFKDVPNGANHAFWKGGVTPVNKKIRQSGQYAEWRTQVFERDDFTCQECGQRGTRLHPHHIKPFAYFPDLRFEVGNGRTLCVECHRKTDTYGNRAKKLYEGKGNQF